MKLIQKIARARYLLAGSLRCRWYRLVGRHWLAFGDALQSLYWRRVSLPLRSSRALGLPAPRLPWWRGFVARWLIARGRYTATSLEFASWPSAWLDEYWAARRRAGWSRRSRR